MKMLKWFVKVMCCLVKQNVCWFRHLVRCFILAPCLNLNMIESILSFLLSYSSIIFLAKGKISKSVTLFLSHIGPKWCWPISKQDFKSNTSLQQSDEIVYFFTCWYQKSIKVIEKYWGGVARNCCGDPTVTLNEWMNWADFLCWCKFKEAKNYILYIIIFGWLLSKMDMGL